MGKSARTAGATATFAGGIAQPPACDAPPNFQTSPPPTASTSTTAPAAHAPDFAFMIRSLIYPRIVLDNP
jgi:hypothetical protein